MSAQYLLSIHSDMNEPVMVTYNVIEKIGDGEPSYLRVPTPTAIGQIARGLRMAKALPEDKIKTLETMKSGYNLVIDLTEEGAKSFVRQFEREWNRPSPVQ